MSCSYYQCPYNIFFLCILLYMNTDWNTCKESETSTISYYNKIVSYFFTPFQFSNCKILYLSCWFRDKSALPLINYKVKVANICVKNDLDSKNCGSKVVGSRRFPCPSVSGINRILYFSRVIIKTPKYIKYVLV